MMNNWISYWKMLILIAATHSLRFLLFSSPNTPGLRSSQRLNSVTAVGGTVVCSLAGRYINSLHGVLLYCCLSSSFDAFTVTSMWHRSLDCHSFLLLDHVVSPPLPHFGIGIHRLISVLAWTYLFPVLNCSAVKYVQCVRR